MASTTLSVCGPSLRVMSSPAPTLPTSVAMPSASGPPRSAGDVSPPGAPGTEQSPAVPPLSGPVGAADPGGGLPRSAGDAASAGAPGVEQSPAVPPPSGPVAAPEPAGGLPRSAGKIGSAGAPGVEQPPAAPRPVGSLSPSRAADFKACPLLYRFRCIDRLPEPPSLDRTRGTVVHGVLERLFDLPASERSYPAAAALVEPEWRRLVEVEPELSGLFADDADGSRLAGWLDSARRMVAGYFALEDPRRLEPAGREERVELLLDGGLYQQVAAAWDRADQVAPPAVKADVERPRPCSSSSSTLWCCGGPAARCRASSG